MSRLFGTTDVRVASDVSRTHLLGWDLHHGLGGCSSTGPSSGGSRVFFNTATQPATTPSASRASFSTTNTPYTISLGGNTLVLTNVQLVAKHVERQRQGKGCDLRAGCQCGPGLR